MFFHIFRRGGGPMIRAKTGGEFLLRTVGLLGVFGLVCWLFWMNSERNMQKILAQSSIYDETQTLSQKQKRALADFAGLFRDEFGLQLRVQIFTGKVEPPVTDSKTLFVGVSPSEEQAAFVFPPLYARALGAAYVEKLMAKYFAVGFGRGDWPRGLASALAEVWETMLDLNNPAAKPAGASESGQAPRLRPEEAPCVA